jgi:hypothetical protein
VSDNHSTPEVASIYITGEVLEVLATIRKQCAEGTSYSDIILSLEQTITRLCDEKGELLERIEYLEGAKEREL